MKYISGAYERRVLPPHLHIGVGVFDVVGQLVVPDSLDDPGGYAHSSQKNLEFIANQLFNATATFYASVFFGSA